MCSGVAFQARCIDWSLIWTLSGGIAGLDFFTHFPKSQHSLWKPRETTEGGKAPGHVSIPK